MRIYRLFNKLARPRSYAGRILLICFVGTHIPLISFAIWTLAANPAFGWDHWADLLVLLLATLAGTALTFALVHGMLAPVRTVAQALEDYRQQKQLPTLPRHLSDEAGDGASPSGALVSGRVRLTYDLARDQQTLLEELTNG